MDQTAAINKGGATLPGYWRFAWMFFMQPVSLNHRLKACGIDKPGISVWPLFHNRCELHPAYLGYFKRLGFLLSWPWLELLLVWMADLAFSIGLPITDITRGVAVGVMSGVMFGALVGLTSGWAFNVVSGVVFGVAFGVLGGVAFGVFSGVMFGVLVNLTNGWAVGVAFSVAYGVVLGISGGLALGVTLGVALGEAGGVALGVVLGVLSGVTLGIAVSLYLNVASGVLSGVEGDVVGGVAGDVAGGVAGGVALGVLFPLSYLRVPLYPLEFLSQWLLYLMRKRNPARTLLYSPVLFHDLSYFPLPFLARHIVEAAEAAPELAARVLAACSIAPGQRRAGKRALAELQAREIATLARQRRFQAVVDLQGRWLPGRDTDSPLLRALADTARFFAAAQGSTSPYLARQHLDKAEAGLKAIDNQLLTSKEPLARFLPDTLTAWRAVLAELRAANEQAAAESLPNPFITGNPLSGEQRTGKELFRGREASIRQVETLLAGDHASLALIGPRRCGKSTLINMFKPWLPDTQVVLFDLQDNPAHTPAAFYRLLAQRTAEQAYLDHRLKLPPFPEGAPIEALRAWLDVLEDSHSVARFLICIDEFARLPGLFPDQGRELLQFMGLLRATIQHRRRVRLLVAGAAPFDELDRLWSDHFINLREIRIGYLDEPACVGLLTRPVAEFPPEAIPKAAARAVVTRTGGQPFLVQLYGSLLVGRLNEAKRKTATADDIELVEEDVVEQAGNYFRDLWSDLPPAAHPFLRALAAGAPAQADPATHRWLRRRLILGEDGALLVPVFGRWLLENVPAD